MGASTDPNTNPFSVRLITEPTCDWSSIGGARVRVGVLVFYDVAVFISVVVDFGGVKVVVVVLMAYATVRQTRLRNNITN
jgi:hypothetical protein